MSAPPFFALPKTEQLSGHSVITNAWGPTKQTQVCLDTRFGDLPSSSCVKGGPITIPFPTRVGHISSLRVLSCELPITFYQYSAAMQNTTFSVGGQPVTVPDRNWTATSLTAFLTTISGTGLSFSYDADINRISMTNINANGSPPIAVSFSCSPTVVFERTRLKSKLGWYMGFRKPEYSIPSGATVIAEGAFVDQPLQAVYLKIVDHQSSSENSMVLCTPISDNNILAKITIGGVPGSMLPASLVNGQLISGTRKYSGKVDLDRISVGIVDVYGRPVALDAEFSVCLEMTHM